ncbi:hypothetical protein L1887_01344 [Cichorium endivia]|nr:hypothetical protein L1887_01344 [Cichorium endivia]
MGSGCYATWMWPSQIDLEPKPSLDPTHSTIVTSRYPTPSPQVRYDCRGRVIDAREKDSMSGGVFAKNIKIEMLAMLLIGILFAAVAAKFGQQKGGGDEGEGGSINLEVLGDEGNEILLVPFVSSYS